MPKSGVDKLLTQSLSLTFLVEVNGKNVNKFIDTGSMQMLVESQLVLKHSEENEGNVVFRYIHGEEQIYSIAEVQVVVQEQPYLLRAGEK